MRRLSAPFLRNRNVMGAIHAIAKTYGVLPSDLLMLEPEEVEMNYKILAEGAKQEREAMEGKKEKIDLLEGDPEEMGDKMDALFAGFPKGVARG